LAQLNDLVQFKAIPDENKSSCCNAA